MSPMDTRFQQFVLSEAELRAVLGQPSERGLTKVRAMLDDRARAYVDACPFVLIASCNAEGRMDFSIQTDARERR